MQTKSLLSRARLLVGATLALSLIKAFGATPDASSDAFPIFDNYIKLSGQSNWVSGDASALQSRLNQPDHGSGGIEDFLFTKDVSKDTTLHLDGHALDGTADYLAHFSLVKNEVGSIDAGYKKFRTFYDGVGGFFPGNQEWSGLIANPQLPNQDLHTDRSKLWVETTINLPNQPVYTLRYTNELRNGTKDSTIWGDTDFTGLTTTTTSTMDRKIIPAYLQLDERHQTLEASMKHTVDKTTFQLTALGDWTNNLDCRFVTRDPGEVKLFAPAPVPLPVNTSNQVLLSQFDGMDTHTLSFTGTALTVFSDKITMRAGFRYQSVNSDFSGTRQLITSTPTATGPVPVTTDQYLGLLGGSRVKVATANLGFDFKPANNFDATLAMRAEDKKSNSNGFYKVVAASGTPATTLATTPRVENSGVHDHSLTPELDLRYTGIKDVALYASASYNYVFGDERDTPQYNTITATLPLEYFNTVAQNNSDYTVGASWRQSSFLSLRAETFYKDHSNESGGYNTNASLAPALPAAATLNNYYLLGSKFTGVKLTVIAKPLDVLSFTTRYIYQKGKMQVTSYQQNTAGTSFPNETYDSMNSTSHSINETVDWTPFNQFYMQANASLVFNVIDTVYPRAGISSIGINANNVLQNSNNNYFTGSLLAGAVVTRTDDLQVQLTYYRADDGNTQLANWTLPYGVSVSEVSVSAGLKHKFSSRLVGSAKVGYFDSRNDTTGGYTNFHGPLAYLALEQAF